MSGITTRSIAMKLTIAVLTAASVACHGAPPSIAPARSAPPTSATVSPRIQADVEFLGSPDRRGRAVGSSGSAEAATYIIRQYTALGLRGAFEVCVTSGKCTPAYYQSFEIGTVSGRNVGVVIEGTDSLLRTQYVVIGAHYDHVGTNASLSLDPKRGSVIRPGADDNASGTAAVLELARRLKANPPRRSILVLHFDGEERGLIGSATFVRHLPVPRASMMLMMNFDMVGRLRKNELTVDKSVLGLSNTGVLEVLDSTAKSYAVTVKFTRDIDGRSDHSSFEHINVPALALFTGFHKDYHTATDVVSKLNLEGISRVVDIAESVVRAAANRELNGSKK